MLQKKLYRLSVVNSPLFVEGGTVEYSYDYRHWTTDNGQRIKR